MLGSDKAWACLWDRDTFEEEVQGIPDVVVTLIGGFARNPAKYYEMRLTRVRALLPTEPDTLALYDDAAVASDRLGDQDQAIALMADKRGALERLGISRDDARAGSPNHWYRYHANLGTFHAHRWFHRGTDWDDIDDLQRGHDLITSAIEDNPDAHFGREKYQLRALAWLLERPAYAYQSNMLPTFIDIGDNQLDSVEDDGILDAQGLGDAIPGLCGLITLGAAWNSFDVTAALAYALAADGRQTAAKFATTRCQEILVNGGRTMVANAPTDQRELLDLLPHLIGKDVSERFSRLRAKADSWARVRDAYLLERLDRGEHPDTHPAFWSAYDGDPSRIDVATLELDPPKPAPARTPKPTQDQPHTRGCACSSSGSDSEAGASGLVLGGALLASIQRLANRRE